MWFNGWEVLMESYHPVKFGCHSHCGSLGMMFLVIEEWDWTCPHLNLPLLFISKAHSMLTQTKFQDVDSIICWCVQWRTPNPGDTCIQQKLTEITWKTFASRDRDKWKTRNKLEWPLKSFLGYTQTQKLNLFFEFITW